MQVDDPSNKHHLLSQHPKSQNLLTSMKYYSGSQESLNSDDSVCNGDLGETVIGGILNQRDRTLNFSELNLEKA